MYFTFTFTLRNFYFEDIFGLFLHTKTRQNRFEQIFRLLFALVSVTVEPCSWFEVIHSIC